MFKLTGSNYPVDKIDATICDVMHMKTMAYMWCFIDMSLYNNFNEESKAHELWEKIDIMFQNKNVVNPVSVFQKLVRLRYQDGFSMAEHMNAF